MPKRKGSTRTRYLIFRMEQIGSGRIRRVYLGRTGESPEAWSGNASAALHGSLGRMRALMRKWKERYPDLILERIDGPSSP